MKTTRPWLLAFALTAAVLAQACAAESEADITIDQPEFDDISVELTCEDVPESEDCVEPRPTALRMDAEDRLGFEAITFDRENMAILMRMKPGAKLPEKLKVGAPIYRGRNDREAFMAIVEAIDRQGDEVRVSVRQAQLKDVFSRGRLRLAVPIQVDPDAALEATAKQMTELSGIGRSQHAVGEFVDLIDYDCRSSIIDVTDFPAFAQTADGSATLPFAASADVKLELAQCNVILSGLVNAKLEWSGIAPDVFEFTIGAGLEIALEVAAELSNIKTDDDRFDVIDTIGTQSRLVKFPSFSVSVAGINVKFTPEVWAGVRFIASGDVTASAGFNFATSAEAGFGWSAGKGFDTIFETTKEFTRIGPNIEQGDDSYVRAYVRPEINVLIGGIVGGSAGLEGYVEITSEGVGEFDNAGEFQGRVCYDMDAGLEPILGADLQVLGATIVSESWRLKGAETNIADGCLETPVPPEPACGPVDECAIDSDCMPAGATACTVYRCTEECTCTVFDAAGCCETPADCDDGVPATLDICSSRSGSCINPPIPGYCEAPSDCDDGLIWTNDSCENNRCQHADNGQPVDPFIGPSPECFGHHDCDDGSVLTSDTCVSGQCRFTTSLVEENRCFDDSDCDDGLVLTRDSCLANGECKHDFVGPGL